MSQSPFHDVFTRICRSMEERYADNQSLCAVTGARTRPLCVGADISLDDLRSGALHGEPDHPDRPALWRHIVGHIREDPEGEGGRNWTLLAVWLLAPRLRGAAYAISRRTGAERADVCSALLQGALEGARTIDRADGSVAEQHLVDSAFAAGWQTGRRNPKETPVAEWGTVQEREGPEPSAIAVDDVVRVAGMSRTLARQAQGERLGSLAYRLGLLAHERQVRRHGRRRPGRGIQHTASEQQGLFGMRGPADEAPS